MKFLLPAIVTAVLALVGMGIIGLNITPVFTAIETQATNLGKLVTSVLPDPRR